MIWKEGPQLISLGDHRVELACWGPPPDLAPTIVLLHEGLGSLALWRDFPALLADSTGFGVLAYSRQGYGGSDPINLPRPLNYMEVEAQICLPKLLTQTALRQVILCGHSDGASIAAIYAGVHSDPRLQALILLAPHFFTEDIALKAITNTKSAYLTGPLKQRLAKYHRDVRGAFLGWCDAWLDPDFKAWTIRKYISKIGVPVLALQGEEDPYGTNVQLDALSADLKTLNRCVMLKACQHAPHQQQTAQTLTLITGFLATTGTTDPPMQSLHA